MTATSHVTGTEIYCPTFELIPVNGRQMPRWTSKRYDVQRDQAYLRPSRFEAQRGRSSPPTLWYLPVRRERSPHGFAMSRAFPADILLDRYDG